MAIEHANIADSDRHENKGASTALDGQYCKANGDGTTSFEFISYDELTDKPTIPEVPVEPQESPEDSVATDVAGLVADFNSLLAVLRDSGLLT